MARETAQQLSHEHASAQHSAPSHSPPNAANSNAASLATERMARSTEYRVITRNGAVSLRSRPVRGDNVIGSIPRGAVVEGDRSERGFIHVLSGGRSGWASAKFLSNVESPSAVATPKAPSPSERTESEAHEMPGVRRRVAPIVDEPTSDYPLVETQGEPFVKGELDHDDIDPNDVRQGDIGDCWLMAVAAAVAHANPEAIRKLIKDNGDGTYDVTLYLSDHVWSEKKPRVIRVDSKFPAKENTFAYARPGDRGKKGYELWPLLLEKAYAQYKGKYMGALGGYIGGIEGGRESQGLDLLLPEESTVHHTALLSQATMMKQITRALSEHRPITASTFVSILPGSVARRRELAAEDLHEYSIEGTNPGANTITLRNPWGESHLVDLPFEDFNRFFRSYAIGPAL